MSEEGNLLKKIPTREEVPVECTWALEDLYANDD